MLNYLFPKDDRLYNICLGFARMVNSCISPSRLTLPEHPQLLAPSCNISLFLNLLSHLFIDLCADMYRKGDSFP